MGNFFKSRIYIEYLSLFSTIFKTISRNLSNAKFEPEVAILRKFLSPGNICIDIGGAYGRYAYPMSKIVSSEGKIYSFEPGSYSFRVISCVKRFHNLKNVVIIKKALSDKEGEIRLFSPLKKSGKVGPSLAFIDGKDHADAVSETVAMTTLDEFIRQSDISRVDFIKCDTEGSELFIYRGAAKTIERFHPVILSEVDDGNLKRYGLSAKEMEEFFKSRNYSFAAFRNGALKPVDHLNESGNYFFFHNSAAERMIASLK